MVAELHGSEKVRNVKLRKDRIVWFQLDDGRQIGVQQLIRDGKELTQVYLPEDVEIKHQQLTEPPDAA